MTLEIARADTDDLPFIMTTERLEGYEAPVGRWDESRHRKALGDERYAYFLAKADGKPVGFAIVCDWASPERVTCVKRVAVARPNYGRELLQAVVDIIFRQTYAHRIWLGVFPDNDRARKVYARTGFVSEGVARGNAFIGGKYRDELIMALLRLGRRSAAARSRAARILGAESRKWDRRGRFNPAYLRLHRDCRFHICQRLPGADPRTLRVTGRGGIV
jgi:diamine N-acetyltransferase